MRDALTKITPLSRFRDGRDVPARYNKQDPRKPISGPQQVIVDLSDCVSIGIPAVLWCAVYLTLSKLHGGESALLAPKAVGPSSRLAATGLFQILRDGDVSVEDNPADHAPEAIKSVLPLTRFDNTYEAEELAIRATEALIGEGLGASDVYSLVGETFAELVVNAAGHSMSPIGAYGIVEIDWSNGKRNVLCGVADGGIGIHKSLLSNPAHARIIFNDWTAIEVAARELVSGTLDKTRGIGLFGVTEDMRRPGRELAIHSGTGWMKINEATESRAVRASLFPGTLALVSIPV